MNGSPESELIAHAASLRSLARALVGVQDADDVVNDAALQALRRPPAGPGSWFGWLQVVVRRQAHRHQRTDRRRRVREAAVASAREVGTAFDVAAHRETVQRLHEALLGLGEPYQGTLLMRYFEGLTPSEIADRMHEPLATLAR